MCEFQRGQFVLFPGGYPASDVGPQVRHVSLVGRRGAARQHHRQRGQGHTQTHRCVPGVKDTD